jgi:RNA polymerase sigma factor (sigma-70 family)
VDPRTADAALVARVIASGDRHAFAALVRQHQAAVRAALRRLTKGDHGLADDLAQETFILAWRNIRSFRAEARFSTWLYRIAYNAFLAHLRGQRKEEPLPEGVRDEPPGASTEALADARMDLARAMLTLSEPERLAIVQCYHNDLTHEEAAYVLGWPLGTVKTHVLRAKRKLKAALAGWDDGGR